MMRSLKEFGLCLYGLSRPRDWVSRKVTSGEPLVRFLTQKSQYFHDGETYKAKPKAFEMSNRYKSLSLYRRHDLTDGQIDRIGRIFVAPLLGRTILGRVDLKEDICTSSGFKLYPLLLPNPRHTDLKGYSDDLALRTNQQQALSNNSVTEMYPVPTI